MGRTAAKYDEQEPERAEHWRWRTHILGREQNGPCKRRECSVLETGTDGGGGHSYIGDFEENSLVPT